MKNRLIVTRFIRPTMDDGRGVLEARLGSVHARALEFYVEPFVYRNISGGDEEGFEREVDEMVRRAKNEVRDALLRELQLEI